MTQQTDRERYPHWPLLCTPNEKRGIESENQTRVHNYVTTFFEDGQGRSPFSMGVVLELHILTMDGLYPCAGEARDAIAQVEIHGSSQKPYPASEVVMALNDWLGELSNWQSHCGESRSEAIAFSARQFHKFEQIHPFRGGNGRVGRSMLHLCLYRMGILQPPETIYEYMTYRREPYYRCLQRADKSDYRLLTSYVEGAVIDALYTPLYRRLMEASVWERFQAYAKKDTIRFISRPALRATCMPQDYERHLREIDRVLDRLAKATAKGKVARR